LEFTCKHETLLVVEITAFKALADAMLVMRRDRKVVQSVFIVVVIIGMCVAQQLFAVLFILGS
jgi:hypothetical protein